MKNFFIYNNISVFLCHSSGKYCMPYWICFPLNIYITVYSTVYSVQYNIAMFSSQYIIHIVQCTVQYSYASNTKKLNRTNYILHF